MKTNKPTKAMAMVLSLILLCSTFVGILPIITNAATEYIDIELIDYPRGGGTDTWGHPALHFMNGWNVSSTGHFSAKAAANKNMQVAYCVQPNVPLDSNDQSPEILPDTFLDGYNNGALNAMEIQKLLGRIFQYGYTGRVTTTLTNDEISEMIATQMLVWETIVGERSSNFEHITPSSGLNSILEAIKDEHPHRSLILSHYNRIANSVINHSKIPSFLKTNTGSASVREMTWNGSNYSVTLTDDNNVLGNFTFSGSGLSFSVSGNKLTISSNTAPTSPVTITATRTGSVRSAVAFWCSNKIVVKGTVQGLVMSGQNISDPLEGFVKVEVPYGTMAIKKTTQHNNGTVSGFQFEVRNSSGTLIGTYTSGSTGVIDIPNLVPGTYSVKEVNLSTDFVEPKTNPKSVTVVAGQTATVSFDNIKKRGVITVRKTDANPTLGGYSLAGAEFEVRDQGSNLVDTIVTDANGRAQTKILPLGVYRVKETKAPYGFALDPETRTATLTGTQGTDEVVYAPDVSVAETPVVGRINIQKANANKMMGDYSLAGAKFEIRADEDIRRADGSYYARKGDLMDTIITDAAGKAQSKDLHLGKYVVTEPNVPYGYLQNTSSYPAHLEYENQNVAVVYKTVNAGQTPQPGRIRVHKQNANPDMGDYDLKNAVFEIRSAETIKCLDGTVIYNKGDLADTITTNSAGEATSKDLPLGTYVVSEKNAPFGFVLNTDAKNVTLSYKGQEVPISYSDVTVPEQPQVGTITVTKYDVTTGTRAQGDASLRGAVFEVFCAADIKKLDGSIIYAKDQLVDTLYCGNATFATTKELPLGSYYVKEKVPPLGYTLDTSRHDITIEYQGQNVAVVRKNVEVRNKVIEGQIAVVKHTDLPDPDVNLPNSQIEMPLDGIKFEIFLKSSGSYAAALATERDILTTNDDGYALSKKLPYGVYTVKELPDEQGRDIKLVAPFDVFISTEGRVYRYILNDPTFTSIVKIIKKDAETGKTVPAAGVSFKVWDIKNNKWVSQSFLYPTPTTIDVFETAPDGTLVMPEPLVSGDYLLYEQEAPWGYVLTKDPVAFTIHSTQVDPAIAEVIMANNPQKGIIKIEKRGNMLTGVTTANTTFGKQYTPVFSLTGLKGAVFEIRAAENIYTPDGTLRYAKGTLVDTITTDNNGLAETKQLYLGQYTVVETKAPEGFVLDKTPHAAYLTYAGQEVAVTSTQIGIGNIRQKVEIELQKLMEKPINAPDNFDPFKDVVFGLFADEDIKAIDGSVVIAKGSLVALMQIDKNGKGVVSGELPHAKYYVQELQTNIYYQLNSTKYPVNAAYQGQDVAKAVVKVNNGGIALPNEAKMGQITITKTGEMLVGADKVVGKGWNRYTPIYEVREMPGVVFDVVALEDIYDVYGRLIHKKGTVVDTITTGADGTATTKLLHIGRYELVEKELPHGYISDGTPIPVTLGFDAQIVGNILEKRVSIYNQRQKSEIEMEKIIEMPDGAAEDFDPYEDVLFGLFSREDIKAVDGTVVIPKDELLEYITFDGPGKITLKSDLPFGSFYVQELQCPVGYVLDENQYEFTFEYDREGPAVIQLAVNDGNAIENRLQRGNLKLIKTFEGKEYPLADIPFHIVGETTVGTIVEMDVVTDENGEINLEGLLVGNYKISELDCDLSAGYILTLDEAFVITPDRITELTIENKLMRGDLKIIKTFEGKSTPIAGIPFTIIGRTIAGYDYEETHVTDENGEIILKGFLIGEYTIRELGCDLSVGFILSEEETAIVANDEITEMKINNRLIRGHVRLIKKASDNGQTLAGAEFELYDPDGNLIGIYITDENGMILVEDLPYGIGYKFKETKAPNGFTMDQTEATFDITVNGETVEVTATNTPVPPPPKTGDDGVPVWVYAALVLSSGTLLGMLVFKRRRRRA